MFFDISEHIHSHTDRSIKSIYIDNYKTAVILKPIWLERGKIRHLSNRRNNHEFSLFLFLDQTRTTGFLGIRKSSCANEKEKGCFVEAAASGSLALSPGYDRNTDEQIPRWAFQSHVPRFYALHASVHPRTPSIRACVQVHAYTGWCRVHGRAR